MQTFFPKEMQIPAVKDAEKVSPKSILPKDAYHFDGEGFVPAGEGCLPYMHRVFGAYTDRKPRSV